MKHERILSFLMVIAIAIGLLTLPVVSSAKDAIQQWELVNPEGVIKIEPMKVNPHPATLEGKTVLLRWNGKPNGDNFLNRVAELLTEHIRDVKIIKLWELDYSTARISPSPRIQ